MAPWCSGYHYCTTSFNKAKTQLLHRYKCCQQRVSVGGLLTIVPVSQLYDKKNFSSSCTFGFRISSFPYIAIMSVSYFI